ncbi:FimV/HubP family polar landmark protein [Noviherbaspirillum massiliense]|uniref:FimV/HubP family polar landmark protein n=1 Tax=Noviherbaspirillum massiliense TaxID=1465823 RepID=UPI0002E5E834|nr:FimV/HubP family polar landmark protein [Noviherbaspirillum massiliense]
MSLNMHSNTRSKSVSFSLKTLSAAVVSALLFSNAYAAGLGKLTVLSSLGQPLNAEIELSSVSKDEAGALVAKLASPEAFHQASIDLNPTLLSLRFAIDERGTRKFIRITSSQPINEPFVDLLLEVGGPHGRLVREYTFLLDPADMRAMQPAQVASIPVPAQGTIKPAQPVVQAEAPAQIEHKAEDKPNGKSEEKLTDAPANKVEEAKTSAGQEAKTALKPVKPAATAAAGEGKSEPNPTEHKIKSGDTLVKIANQVKPSGVSLDQMLVGLYRANPHAFAGKNMNRLRAGQILSVPDADTTRSVSKAEAHSIVVAQSADFANYRNKLASQVAEATPQKSEENKQSATGKITAKVEEQPTPASESKDKLKLSKALPAANAGQDKASATKGGATVSEEDKIAKEKELAEADARVKELEKNVNDLQKVLEVKNKGLAEQQQQAAAAKADPVKQEPAKPDTVVNEKAPAAPGNATASSVPVTAPSASTKVDAVPASEQQPAAPAQAEPAQAKAEQPDPAHPAAPVYPAAVKPAPAPVKPKPKVAPPVAPQPEPSFFDDLMNNPLLLPGAGILLVGLGALGIFISRRRKQSKQFGDSIITDSSLKANSLFGSTGGQSVDTNNSVFNSNFAPSANQLDTNEVDPIAEADVYIAYGRDAQAEEILKEALRTQPERHAVRVKLLEIYASRKDLRAFEVLATELYGMTKGEGADWAQAALLGASVDPNNPLYAGGKKSGEKPKAAPAPAQPAAVPEVVQSLEANSSHFDHTSLVEDAAPEIEVPAKKPAAPKVVEEKPSVQRKNEKAPANELDFDLAEMDLGTVQVPNTIPRPAPTELHADLGSIDFDFLETPKATEKPAVKAAPAAPAKVSPTPAPAPAASSIDLSAYDLAPLELNASEAEPVSANAKTDAPVESHDFDLSGISLELDAAPEAKEESVSLSMDDIAPMQNDSSGDSEMATKLDLAVAYREIGDKEGARELLDEVLKGGTPEQSERAKSLLLELA